MIYRLHSTPEIDVNLLVDCLIKLYVFDEERAISVFQQAFKTLPKKVVVDILEQKIPYDVCGSIIVIDTKRCI